MLASVAAGPGSLRAKQASGLLALARAFPAAGVRDVLHDREDFLCEIPQLTRQDHEADGAHGPAGRTENSSITGLARSSAASSAILARAASSAGPLSSTSNLLPCRTARTCPNPRR